MKNSCFVYTMSGRVVWSDSKVQSLPVIAEIFRVHQVDSSELLRTNDCTHYMVENMYRFDTKLVLLPPKEDEVANLKLINHKIKMFIDLSNSVNNSYKLSLPSVFLDEADKLEMLAKYSVNTFDFDEYSMKKHISFISQNFAEKKEELKRRYLEKVSEIKQAETLEQLQKLAISLEFERINVI